MERLQGVLFGDTHTLKDWGLLLKSRPVISPPKAKTTFVNIPEADGSIDLTERLTGEVHFERRQMRCEFVVMDARNRWSAIYSEVMNKIHGLEMQIVFDNDLEWYYIGRVYVDDMETDRKTATIVVTGDLEPYKRAHTNSSDDWLWDDLNFVNGVIQSYKELDVVGSVPINLYNARMIVSPVITVSGIVAGTAKVHFDGTWYNIFNGDNLIPEIRLKPGVNRLTFRCDEGCKVTITYRMGSL